MKLLFYLVLCATVAYVTSKGLNEEFSWSRITYDWTGLSGRNRRQTKGRYGSSQNSGILFPEENDSNEQSSDTSADNVPDSVDYQYVNNIPMGANVWKNKLFITVPRRRLGVPSTLNYVPLDSRNRHNVPLRPYPDWETNLYPSASTGLVSVYRIDVDPCDRLWFVDTGTVEVLGNVTQVQPSAIVVIDLNTDQIIRRYEFPADNFRPATSLASIKVDVTKNTCSGAYAYMPDLSGYGLVVYSFKDNRSWRVSHNYFYVEPIAGEFDIAGHKFQWSDGIFSVELTDVDGNGERTMYFHAMAGTHMYKVPTRILKNHDLATRSYHAEDFQIVGDRGPLSQTSQAEIHKPSGVMFLGLVNQNAVGCWNTRTNLKDIDIVQKDDQKMIYPSDVKVYEDRVYILTNTMPEFLYGALNYDQTNFRVWSNNVGVAIKGTRCEGRRGGSYGR